MSTRAVYGFQDQRGEHWVFVHHDGYPTGAADKFALTLQSNLAWPLPRFEADEFAAAFVAANKTRSGSVRLTSGPNAHGDTEYCYKVGQLPDGTLQLMAWDSGKPINKPFFCGPLDDFIANAEDIEKKIYNE